MVKYNVGVIGLGARGKWWVTEMLSHLEYVNIVGLCDLYEDRIDSCITELHEKHAISPSFTTTDYRELIENPCVEVVLVLSSWNNHCQAAIKAMRCHKPVACEVGGAYTIDQCFDLVRTYEDTHTPFMLLENCCYGKTEMTVANMVKNGLFGEIVHCDGGYMHDLREEVAYGIQNRHYRFNEYKNRNCENYPTHEIGPIAKLLNINRGNRFLSLVSMSSKACGLNAYIQSRDDIKETYGTTRFAQGDICTTIIKCAHGETITLTLDTTLPRYYSRNFTVRGTKGMYEENTHSFLFDGVSQEAEFNWIPSLNNENEYFEKWKHPLWTEHVDGGVGASGHGGMDYFVIDAFFTALRENRPMPINVYDAANWMSISCLSEQSIALGCAPVAFPDFTNGKWYLGSPSIDWKYSL